MALDDNGNPIEVSDDPLKETLQEIIKPIKFGEPATVGDNLRPLLENSNIFGVNLYEVGLGKTIETMVASMISKKGAVRETLNTYLN